MASLQKKLAHYARAFNPRDSYELKDFEELTKNEFCGLKASAWPDVYKFYLRTDSLLAGVADTLCVPGAVRTEFGRAVRDRWLFQQGARLKKLIIVFESAIAYLQNPLWTGEEKKAMAELRIEPGFKIPFHAVEVWSLVSDFEENRRSKYIDSRKELIQSCPSEFIAVPVSTDKRSRSDSDANKKEVDPDRRRRRRKKITLQETEFL